MDSRQPELLREIARRFKSGPVLREPWLPVSLGGKSVAWLEPVTWLDANSQETVAMLSQWHHTAWKLPVRRPYTAAGTQRWLVRHVLNEAARLLFWVTRIDGVRIGHVGLCSFDHGARAVEIENVLRGSPGALPGVFTAATNTIVDWAFRVLPIEACTVRALADAGDALKLYGRCGFYETGRQSMMPVEKGEMIEWVDATEVAGDAKVVVTMMLDRLDWLRANRPVEVAA